MSANDDMESRQYYEVKPQYESEYSPDEYSKQLGSGQVPSYEDNVEWNYAQPLPSIIDPVKWYFKPFKQRSKDYVISLFPFFQWIYRYNSRWLYGDLVAGLTVGIVVVPQGMSYAKVAGLPVQYGSYSSFIGVMLYCFFATSKDVSIGPVAVMSSETYKITHEVLHKVPGLSEKDLPMIAGVSSSLCGGICMGLGVLRLGFLLEYIPMPAVLGFMTGSAFTIAVGQVPSLMGINHLFDTRTASYEVVINTLKHLGSSNVNAAFGLVCLFMLYLMKFGCGYLEKRDKKRKWLWFYLNTMRSALVIIFSTSISWGCYRIYGKTDISMIKTVPRGSEDVGLHPVDPEVASALGSESPIATVVLVSEHIAIAKSFGRINEYRVNPNQESIAIGISNLIGHFFCAYPNTGSFSRTALKNKCGVRTPSAGIFTGVCVLVAIYASTDAFYYISNAALAAIIINAVGDLIASYKSTWKFFLVSPIECSIFIVDVFLCVFVTLEAGIYFSVAASLVFSLLKQTFPLGEFSGKVEFTRHVSDHEVEDDTYNTGSSDSASTWSGQLKRPQKPVAALTRKAVTKGKKITNFFSRHEKSSEQVEIKDASPLEGPEKIQASNNGLGDESGSSEYKPSSKRPYKNETGNDNVHSIHSSDESSFDNEDNQNGGEIEELDDVLAPRGSAEPNHQYTKPVVQSSGVPTTKWWPLNHNNIHPGIRVVPPPPGISVYRFRESLTYQNASWQSDRIVEYVRENTRRNVDLAFYKNQKLGDRPWNEPGPRKYKPPTEEDHRPILRAIIFDMSCSPHVDSTGAQVLWDCHQEVTKYACVPVEFHFAGILSPWARRALVNSGFGSQKNKLPPHTQRLVEIGKVDDPEAQLANGHHADYAPVVDTENCYFHFDIPDSSYR